MTPLRKYLQDWERHGLDELELFLAEDEFHCVPGLVVEGGDIPPELWIESDEIIVEVVPAPTPPEEPEWMGFTVFSEVHPCVPPGDSQQYSVARLVDFVFCDEPECGGLGGWLVWWSTDPAHHPDHPDNPLLPYK